MLPLESLSLAIAAGGVLAGVVVAASTVSAREGIRAMLDMWMGAGLLKLAENASWSTIAIAASVVALRRLVASNLLRPSVV